MSPVTSSFPLWVRAAVAVASVAAAAAHVPVTSEHLHEAPYMGVAFVVFTVACGAVGLVVLARGAAADFSAAATLCAAAIATYAATRLVAFPQLADDVGNWTETLGLVSVGSELVVVVLSVAAIRPRRGGGFRFA